MTIPATRNEFEFEIAPALVAQGFVRVDDNTLSNGRESVTYIHGRGAVRAAR